MQKKSAEFAKIAKPATAYKNRFRFLPKYQHDNAYQYKKLRYDKSKSRRIAEKYKSSDYNNCK